MIHDTIQKYIYYIEADILII